jgi:serine/threonine-protein kinase
VTRFGKYVLENRLASGGMAEVYAARVLGPAGFEKRVALKHILPELSSEPEFVEMFGREARLAAQLQHSNIVQVFDFGHEGGIHFLAMELVEGYDLRRLGERLR